MSYWKNLNNDDPMPHYSVFRVGSDNVGMEAIRDFFPDARADELNFVLFSTSGVHGRYTTIEDAEACLREDDEECSTSVTFLIVQPRIVAVRYGNCHPKTPDDIEFLKRLRESSLKAVGRIGMKDAPK